jgi:hypothetical protein
MQLAYVLKCVAGRDSFRAVTFAGRICRRLAKALQIGGNRSAADAALKHLIDKDAGFDLYEVAQVYAIRNDADKTFEWLDRAWSSRDPGIASLHYDPFIARYKNDPRFTEFCRKVGLPTPAEVEARR